MLAEFQAHAAMAAPLIVAGDVLGALVFLRDAEGAEFHRDSAEKASIIAAQLGTALEALRLTRVSDEEHRRTMILAEVATTLHAIPDTSAIMEGVSDRLRSLLHSPAVLIFVRQNSDFSLQAVSANAPATAQSIRQHYRENQLREAVEIAGKAVASGERIAVRIDGPTNLGDLNVTGTLIAAPF